MRNQEEPELEMEGALMYFFGLGELDDRVVAVEAGDCGFGCLVLV